tara:strand:+ start:1756 stop:2613 length:858 start_codon:yes stop_codon:yes gene_type:complete
MKYINNFIIFFALIFIFELVYVKKDAQAACAVTAGVVSETDVNDDGCEVTPTLYEVVIYKLYLCTSAPTAATTTSAVSLENCSQVFENISGATASVSSGADVNLSGTYTRPPEGTYTHGYALMDNTFGLTWSGQLSGAKTGLTGGTGVYCATVAGSGTHQQASTHTNSTICGSSEITPGKFVETLKHFDDAGEDFENLVTATNLNGTSAAITGYLIDSNGHLAANSGEVETLEGLVQFASSIEVTAETTSLTMSFNTGSGMFLSDAGSDKLYAGSGPFQAIMTAN